MYANNSIYTTVQTFAGLTFAAGEYSFMLGHYFRWDTYFFIAISIFALTVLWARKSRLDIAQRVTYTLSRPYLHILADYLYAIGTVGAFAIISFMYSQKLSFIDMDQNINLPSSVLFGNFAALAISYALHSYYAAAERKVAEQPNIPSQLTP